jgi:hypothetical protein
MAEKKTVVKEEKPKEAKPDAKPSTAKTTAKRASGPHKR